MKTALLLILLFTSPFLFAQTTAITDPNFEQALIDLGLDDVLDGQLLNTNVENITSLDVSDNNIADLSGIEAFLSIEFLNCSYNSISSLDLSQNGALADVSVNHNLLTSLDVSNNLLIEGLGCQNNQLTILNLTNNFNLNFLNCENNQLTELILGDNDLITYLACCNNQFTVMDCSQLGALNTICVRENNLICLNLNNGTNLEIINAHTNPNLTCIEVFDAAYAESVWTNTGFIDSQVTFSEDCDNPCSTSNAGLDALNSSPKTLTQILDLMGRETTFKPNTPLIYVYDDGSMERVYRVE